MAQQCLIDQTYGTFCKKKCLTMYFLQHLWLFKCVMFCVDHEIPDIQKVGKKKLVIYGTLVHSNFSWK